jgi:serine/threonine-protein kinase
MSHSPTITDEMTRPGVVLGTAGYMSPEQAKGKTVDKRADIWAFGCVLYECLTGKRAFQGDTITETVAAILKSEPDWTLLPTDTLPFVRSLLRQCLQKDTSLRLRDIGDARVEMRDGLSEPAEVMPVAQRFPLGWILSIGAAALVIAFLSGMVVMKYIRPAASPISQPVVRSSVRLEPGYWLDGWRRSPPSGFDQPTRTAMAISGDGRFMVYSAIKENPTPQDKPQLYLRRFDQLEAKPITRTEGGISPFLSPDDRWVGFWADGKLMKVSVDGGVPTPLCDVPYPFGFSWGADSQIVCTLNEDRGLSRVSAGGGKPETLTIPDKSEGEYSHRLPHCLPAGKGILFTIMRSDDDPHPRAAVMESTTRKWHVLLEDAADARFVATGHLAFLRQGTLMVVPFDLDRLALTGEPIPAVANVMQALNVRNSSWNTATGQFSISAAGSMAYAPGGILPDMENSLVWVDHKGKAEPIASFKAPFSAPRLSPDGQRIAYQTSGKESRVWIYDLNRGTATKLNSEGRVSWVTLTPDGRRVVFGWSKAGPSNIYWQPADGSSPMERLTTSEYNQLPGPWSADGETLALVQIGPDSDRDILFLQMRDRRVTPFLNSRFDEMYPEPSPDGRWIAHVSDESGRSEVYVRQFPGPGGKWQISNEGGVEPLWSRNGKQLFYHQGKNRWVVDIQTGPGFSASKPRLLFDTPGYAGGEPIRSCDISLDGRHFLMVKLEERKPQPVTEMILVQNWFEELKRLCPTGI